LEIVQDNNLLECEPFVQMKKTAVSVRNLLTPSEVMEFTLWQRFGGSGTEIKH
jgi:hypothetical protein